MQTVKKIAVFCVNYNTYKELDNYIASLEVSSGECPNAEVDVYVADNTEKNYKEVNFDTKNVRVKVFGYHKNHGYFGGVERMMKEVDMDQYDFFIISNVDLTTEKDTFVKLLASDYDENVGIIAPQIYSIKEHKDRNPKKLTRYTREKLEKIMFLYSHPFLNSMYCNLVYRFRKQAKPAESSEGYIYMAHGSFIILTKEYYKRCGIIDYPVFLFCEEIYLAEMCLKNNLRTIYKPQVRILDIDHASTGRQSNKLMCEYNCTAIKYILDKFF